MEQKGWMKTLSFPSLESATFKGWIWKKKKKAYEKVGPFVIYEYLSIHKYLYDIGIYQFSFLVSPHLMNLRHN